MYTWATALLVHKERKSDKFGAAWRVLWLCFQRIRRNCIWEEVGVCNLTIREEKLSGFVAEERALQQFRCGPAWWKLSRARLLKRRFQ